MLSPPESVARATGLGGERAPMEGMVLCCTSISPEKRADLASIAAQMGAIHKFDLTSDVTHLIVGDTETPKFKFVAKERPDVKCLLPAWVEALRELWMTDVEPDMQALEARYRLPTLHHLRICVTGFEDMAYRKKLEDDVNDNGGEYRGNLTKDITHLIAKEPSGAKYRYAIEWKIKIVGVEWLEQTLERGLILDEQLYNLSLPPAERGRDAWVRRTVSSSSLGKRPFDGDVALNGPRKLRRVASARLNSQNIGLWTDIVKNEVKTEDRTHDQWSELLPPPKPSSAEESFRPVKSIGTLTEGSIGLAAPSTTETPHAGLLPRTGIFASQKICLYGFNDKKTTILHKHLLSHDADVLPNPSSFTPSTMPPPDNEFLLIPHDLHMDSVPSVLPQRHHPVVVTDMWVERCLHRKKHVRPEEHVTSTPFRKFPIPGFERLVVCSTTFEDVDLLHISKTVRLIGATYDEDFSPKASVLVCNKVVPGHEKMRHAQLWNIPTVTAEWLWDCIRSGSMKGFRSYLAQPYMGLTDPEVNAARQQIQNLTASEDRLDTCSKNVNDTNERGSMLQSGMETVTQSRLGFEGKKSITHDHMTTQDRSTRTDAGAEGENPQIITNIPHLQPHAIAHDSRPLQEISPNSSPPRPSESPFKITKNTVPIHKPPSQDTALSSTISSLLAQHQNARSATASKPNPTTAQNQNHVRIRRKRQLLGRAPSNTSNLSRASSVDTVNTDGVGTPVELTRSASTVSNSINTFNANSSATTNRHPSTTTTDGLTFDPLATFPNAGTPIENGDHMQMTQLGYEDPDALAWREKVERKLGTITRREGDEAEGMRRRVKEIGTVKDLTGKGAGAVGKRTRQAQAQATGR